jgi:hypothetical protein
MDPQAVAALVGAAVGGGFTVIGTVVTQLWSGKWRREDEQSRAVEAVRSKRLEHYSNAIYYCYKLGVSAAEKGVKDEKVRQALSEAQRHLLLLEAFAPERERNTIADYAQKIDAAARMEVPQPPDRPAPLTASEADGAAAGLKGLATAILTAA